MLIQKSTSPFGEVESYCGLLVHCILLLLFRFFCMISFYILAFLEPPAFYLNREGLLIYSVICLWWLPENACWRLNANWLQLFYPKR
jgi:hypothetical protein